jgi:O-6-methylguanine DNA methyltransferase
LARRRRGERVDLPWAAFDLRGATPFQRRVWRAMYAVPCGETRTYGQLAAAAGRPRAARAVGRTCGSNPVPLLLPCHRVTARAGLGGFGPGPEWKRFLLRLEGAL